ncbi:MAG: 4-oxalocrotonate tautomerase [Elusimicrobia bacterium RIFOXYA2_FULL_39_19]|nr:MAG: 4-oxalocrotonate tautomerase [Elusimicrobia bacterium RIFOXYA2_FULL_39_19]
MPVVEIQLWAGRSKDQKRNMVQKVTAAVCETIECPPESVHIIITDVEKDNWGLAGKLASELPPKK